MSGEWGRATAKPNDGRRSSADGFAVRMERTKAGAGFFYPVPRFRQRNGNGKNPDGQGFKSGDFFAPFAKKYSPSLDCLDSRNGAKCGLPFAVGRDIISTVAKRQIGSLEVGSCDKKSEAYIR